MKNIFATHSLLYARVENFFKVMKLVNIKEYFLLEISLSLCLAY